MKAKQWKDLNIEEINASRTVQVGLFDFIDT